MIRVKLVEARETHGLTQTQLGEQIGVTERAIRCWEHGERGIRGKYRRALCTVLGLSDADLDVFWIDPKDATASSVARTEMPPLCDGLDNQLLTTVMLWPRGNAQYIVLQVHIHTLMEKSMDKHRRKAMELLSTLPISLFGLSTSAAPLLVMPEETLPWIAAGIVAVYKLSRGTDLAMADSIAAAYLQTLEALINNAQYRRPAAILATQAYSLRAVLGWHVSTNEMALKRARLAEKYAGIAQDAALLVDAVHRTGVIYHYGGNHVMALQKLQEARHIMEHNDSVPFAVKSLVYLDLATYQARCGNIADAKQSLRLFAKFRSTLPEDKESTILFSVGEYNLLCLEGRAMAALGDHKAALGLYEQIARNPDNAPKAERGRIELLNNRGCSLLALPNADMKECIKLLADAISSAQNIESEHRFAEALALLAIMEQYWPCERDVKELREVATHW